MGLETAILTLAAPLLAGPAVELATGIQAGNRAKAEAARTAEEQQRLLREQRRQQKSLEATEEAQARRRAQQSRRGAAAGRAGTILTGPLGIEGGATTSGNTLLGL